MSSCTLSSVLERHLRSLCLNNFPCGKGNWSKARTPKLAGGDDQGADKQDQDALVDLLTCAHSPWHLDASWSPQTPALRELSIRLPQRIRRKDILKHFIDIRIVDKGISIIDDCLLKFVNLRELVLSANQISLLHGGHLPKTLTVLELYANQLSSLQSLAQGPPPHVQHLGLGSNRLGSLEDIQYLTGATWPKLLSLDLSWCEFQEQQALVSALATLPCLRALVLEGNPLALAPCYPGFLIDSLPGLLCLDTSQISPDHRHSFRGFAAMRELIVDQTVVTVTVRRIRGIPDPALAPSNKSPKISVVACRYYVTYEFISQQPSDNKSEHDKCESAEATEGTRQNCIEENDQVKSQQMSMTNMMIDTEGRFHDVTPELRRQSTPKLAWAECTDLNHSCSYFVNDLGKLKTFLTRGIWLRLEEEKIQSRRASSHENQVEKPIQTPAEKKGAKGKENKAGAKQKLKEVKNVDPVLDMVQDPPIRTVLGSVHIPLRDLLLGSQRADTLCDFGHLFHEPSPEVTKSPDEKADVKGKESTAGQKNAIASNEIGRMKLQKSEDDVHMEDSPSQLEPVTVEFSMQLEKWQSVSEAHRLLPQEREEFVPQTLDVTQ